MHFTDNVVQYILGVFSEFIKEDIDMAFKITDECVSCGACAAECPVNAISEGNDKYVIDPDACISCGNCAAVCPVSAPVED